LFYEHGWEMIAYLLNGEETWRWL